MVMDLLVDMFQTRKIKTQELKDVDQFVQKLEHYLMI